MRRAYVVLVLLASLLLTACCCGCGGDIAFKLAAAKAMRESAFQAQLAVDEYQDSAEAGDITLEVAAIEQFVAMDPNSTAEQRTALKTAFVQALVHLRNDQTARGTRYQRTKEYLSRQMQLADKFEALAAAEASLDDEMQQLFGGTADLFKELAAMKAEQREAAKTEKTCAANALLQKYGCALTGTCGTTTGAK